MNESDTYLAILDEGQEKFAREIILLMGQAQLGDPEDTIKDQLRTIADLDRLRRMALATRKATSWQEILNTP